MKRIRKPMPAWYFLVGILIAVSLTTALLIVPGLLFPRPDFALVPKYSNLTVYAFNCGPNIYNSPCEANSTTLTIKPLASFTGIVTLSTAASNPGIIVTIGGNTGPLVQPAIVSLGPSTDLRLSAESATIGNYSITVNASSGAITHSLVVPVFVRNVTLALSASSLTIARGTTGTVQLTMTSINRAAPGNLTMAGNVLLAYPEIPPSPVNVSFTPSSLILQPGASVTTTVTVSVGQSATTGNRAFTVSVYSRYSFSFYIPLTVT